MDEFISELGNCLFITLLFIAIIGVLVQITFAL